MQELYLDRLLALEFDESDNGGYARRWACYAEILGFWGVSAFWDWRFREVEGDGDWENDVVRRVRWQNVAVKRASYEIGMLRLRIIFHRGRQYLRGGQNLRRLQRRGVRRMEKEAGGSWESYKEDLETYPRAVEWAVCETPEEERVSSSVDAARERDSLASMEMAAGVNGRLNMVITVDGVLWRWDPSSLKWVALEVLDEPLNTSSGEVQNEDHDENEAADDQWNWIENFLGPLELPPRRIGSSAASEHEGLGGNEEVDDRPGWIDNFLDRRELSHEEPNTSGEVQNYGHDENEEVEHRPDWIENSLGTRELSLRRIESSAATPEVELDNNPPTGGNVFEGWAGFSQGSGNQQGYDGTVELEDANPSTDDAATSSVEVRNEGHDEVLEMTEDPNLTTHKQTLLEILQRETVRGPTAVGGGLFDGCTVFSQRSNYQQSYDGIAEPKPGNPSTEQDRFEKFQKLILQPETTVRIRLEGMRQLTAYTYTSEDRAKWTVDDWSASREFWSSEPWPLEQMLEAQEIVPASDSTAESLLLELIEAGGSKAVLSGEKRTDSGVGFQDEGMELTPSIRTAEQQGGFSQPGMTVEEQLIDTIQQQGMRAVMGEPKPAQKVGWIMGRMVLYNPEEEELGDFCVRKIRRSIARERSKERPAPPISLTSFTCHKSTAKSTAKPPVHTPDRPSQVSDESTQPPTPPIPIGPVPWTGQPRHLAPYQPRHLSLPMRLVEILKLSSRDARQDKPSISDPISDGAPLAFFHPNPVAWYSEWLNSRTYATTATDPAPIAAGKKPAMKKLGRRKKDADHEPSAPEQVQNNVIVDDQRVLDREPGMPRVQSMFDHFQLRGSQASIGVAVECGDSRQSEGIAFAVEKRSAFPSPPPPPPPLETPRSSTHKPRGLDRDRGRGRGAIYREREGRNEEQSETPTTEGQDIIREPAIPRVATEQALDEAGGAQLTVDESERRINDAEHETSVPERNRNNEVIIEHMALNKDPGMAVDEHKAELSQLKAYRTSLGLAVEYVNSRQGRKRYGRNERIQGRGRSRGGTYRERYPMKWKQIQASAIEGQRIVSKPGSSKQNIPEEVTEQEPSGPEQEVNLKAPEEESDHPPVSSADSGVEQISRLASLGLEDYASDISEEDADGEAPLASSDSNAYANARSLIAEEMVRVPKPRVTSVQAWAQIVQRERPQEPTARVEDKVQDDPQGATEKRQHPKTSKTEVREILSRPKRASGKGRGKGRQRQPRQGQQPRAADIEGQDIISKPDSLPSTHDILEENERRHICMYDLAATQGPDAIAKLLAQRAAIRDRLVWMSDRMADKGTTRDQRLRMVAVGWRRWFNWKDRGGTGSFSFDEEGSWVAFLNTGGFGPHLPLVQPASSIGTAANAPIMPGNSATPSVSAVPPSAAPTASSSFLSEAELLRHLKRNRASAERKAKKKAAVKAETNTNNEIEGQPTSSSRDKGKMKATDFRGVPISYAEGPDTTSEDTALEATELEEMERITDDAGQGTAFSAATAANAPIRPGNSATPSASSTSVVPSSAISIAASPDNWLIRLMRNISPNRHERSRPNARGRARQKAYANAEANTADAIEKSSTSSSQDKGNMEATNFTGAPIPISYVTDETKAAQRNQTDELAELGGPEVVTGDSMKVEDDARGTSQDTSLVSLTEENEHDTQEEAPLSPIRDAAEPRSRSDSTRRVIWGPDDPVTYEDSWNSAPKPPPEVPDARTEHDRTAEVPFGMIEIDGCLECIGEVERAEDEARRMGRNERFEPNAHQERRTVRADGTVKFIIQPMVRPPRWNIDVRRPVVSLGSLDMGPRTARELCQLREQDAKNARKARRASRTTRGEEGRHAFRQMLYFPAFSAFTTAEVDEEKVEDDARRIGQEELFEVEEGPRISVQLPPEPDSSCSSVDDPSNHLVGFSDNSELDNN